MSHTPGGTHVGPQLPLALRYPADQRFETFVRPPDVLEVARTAHAAMPEIPLKGCDIMREAGSGRFYVLEVNPGGNTWHFSSRFLADIRRKNGVAFEQERRRQFDAMRTAARVLVEKTLSEAT